jgi:hypothetical protein
MPLSGIAGAIAGAVVPAAGGPSTPESAEGQMIQQQAVEQAKKQKEEKCNALKSQMESAIAEYRRCDGIIGELLPAFEDAEKLRGAQVAIYQAGMLIDEAQSNYNWCAGKQSLYWVTLGWWMEGITNLVPKYIFWTGTALGFSGAIGSIEGEKVAAGLIRMGVSATRIASIAGKTSFIGFTVFAPISAANYFGPEGRAAHNEMLKDNSDARIALADFRMKVNQVLNKLYELRDRYATEKITLFDQEERKTKIGDLQAEMKSLQCPDVPDTSGLPPVRGLDVGWRTKPVG